MSTLSGSLPGVKETGRIAFDLDLSFKKIGYRFVAQCQMGLGVDKDFPSFKKNRPLDRGKNFFQMVRHQNNLCSGRCEV